MLNKDEFLKRLLDIKLLSIDIDGTLTDGSLYYNDDGSETRKYNVYDGVGVLLIAALGVKTAVVSTGTTNAIRNRAQSLNIDHIKMNAWNKSEVISSIMQEEGLSKSQVAHIGDDINDMSAFEACGLKIAVNSAMYLIKDSADYILTNNGGMGAMRELAHDFYQAYDEIPSWDKIVEHRKTRQASLNKEVGKISQ